VVISLNGPCVAVVSVCVCVSRFKSVNVFVCLSSPGVAVVVCVCVSLCKSVSVYLPALVVQL